VGKPVEQEYFVGWVGLVVGDRPNHSDCSDDYAPQLDFVDYTQGWGNVLICCPHRVLSAPLDGCGIYC